MRWAPDARGRLERAAFELFAEHGYDDTTVPQIAERAGLTTRTFFRYFADKREVIFGGNEIPTLAAELIRAAPDGQLPADVTRSVLHQVARRFDGQRAETAVWRRMIAENDSLRDRDARKRADLVTAATVALEQRGLSPFDALLHAEAGALAFTIALEQWAAGDLDASLVDAIDAVLERIAVR